MMQPRRWKDRGDGSMPAEVLSDAHAATGDAARVDRAWEKLEPIALAIAAERPAPEVVPAHAQPLHASTGAKLLIGAALLGLAGAGYRVATSASSQSTRPEPARTLVVAQPTAAAEPSAPPPSVPAISPNAAAPELEGATKPRATPPSALKPRTRSTRAAATARRAVTPSVEGESEVALLTRAERLLATTPREALALLAQHEERFPDGVLVQEREVMRIDAERALGRNAAANQHARAFLARFPRSAHRHRFEALLDSASEQTRP